jgi:hypothetical protein
MEIFIITLLVINTLRLDYINFKLKKLNNKFEKAIQIIIKS